MCKICLKTCIVKKQERKPGTFEVFEDSSINSSGNSAAETETNSYNARKKTRRQ